MRDPVKYAGIDLTGEEFDTHFVWAWEYCGLDATRDRARLACGANLEKGMHITAQHCYTTCQECREALLVVKEATVVAARGLVEDIAQELAFTSQDNQEGRAKLFDKITQARQAADNRLILRGIRAKEPTSEGEESK